MPTIQNSITINAPVEAVEAVANDPQRWSEWYAGILKAEPDELFPEVGGVVAVTYQALGIELDMQFNQLEYEPNRRSLTRISGRIRGRNQITLQAVEDGTLLTFRMEYKPPGGLIGRMVGRALVNDILEENLEESLQQLKAIIESGPLMGTTHSPTKK
jgi:carbon monoxide dehydrogenase subunit G